MTRLIFGIFFVVVSGGVAMADGLPTLIGVLSDGEWGWPEGENTCPLNPQKLEFSRSGEILTIRWNHTHDPAVYRVLYNDSDSITMLLNGRGSS